MQIMIASDHAGFDLKTQIQKLATKDASGRSITWIDLGPGSNGRVDYPDFAESLAKKIANSPGSLGILICGSGIGMSIAANKVKGVRAALVENPVAARLAREHNDANVLCLGSRFLAPEYATEIVATFLATAFTADARHAARIAKITQLEK